MNKKTVKTSENDFEILENESLSKYSYMKTGGKAKKIIFPLSEEGFIKAINDVENKNAYVFGNCSNVIFPDEGVDTPIILTTKMKKITVHTEQEYTYLTAEAGASLGILAKTAFEHSLTGLEFAHGIPGTVGGAVFMNAGAYDGEIKDVFYSCRCIDENGKEKTLYSEDMFFSYRSSLIQTEKIILLSATFRLKKGNKEEIKALMDDLMERRRSKQPLEYPSVGSFFKRPTGYYAAKLIDDAGLKGFSVGDAQVSEKHSGFVINKGNATTKDILSLAEIVEKTVYEKFGVRLEKEARIIK